MLGLPARHSSTQLGLNEVKGRWQGRARSVRISQVAQVRTLCERPTIQRCLVIACCQRAPTATLTAKVVLPWDVGCVTHVLSQSEKRDDDYNVRVRLRMRVCRGVLTQAGEAVDPGTVRGEMAKLNPGKTTGTPLDRTDANGERPPQTCTTSEQMQRSVSHRSIQESESVGGEAKDGAREEVPPRALRPKNR